ncbi:MAG: type IV pilin protein [Gammaproteobacteria bacterium]
MKKHDFSKRHGFTLIDMLIALAILGILAALAYPGYLGALHKVRRVDAMNALLQVQAAQARYRGRHAGYAEHLSELGWAVDRVASPEGYYSVRLLAGGENGYLALAEPRAGGSQAADRCRRFVLDQNGPNPGRSSHPDCWSR